MRKLTSYLILGSFIALVASGCDEFLSHSDPTSFTKNNYYTNPGHAEAAVNAIYEDLRAVRGGGFGGAPWLMTEFQTGLANTELGQATNSLDIRALDNSADNGYGQTYWNSHYRGIANANEALANIPNIEQLGEAQQNELLGEARFLRAYYYYNLVRIFGDVPLILEPVGLDSDNLAPERTPVADVYEAIVNDLTWVESNSGLAFNNESGRVTMGAVKTLLSSVYLTMAGYPMQGGDQYYQLARDKAKEVIDSNEYSLFDTYGELKQESLENTGEHIFMVQFDADIIDHNGLQYVTLPYNQDISVFSAETGGIFAQEEFVESYEDGDKRTEEKQFYYREFSPVSDRSTSMNLGGWYLYKFFDHEANVETAVSGMNWPLFRYAEVLFIFAEAENEVNGGPTTAAYDAVNAIRDRAEIPDLSGLSQEEFRKEVLEEKFHELSFENKAWFDMVRLRKAYNPETGEFEDYVGHTFVYGPTLSERELLYPIPAPERRNNENLTQNPGY
ncbi:MAG: RagB/SusD family nutrient uptake outer membrane protein [Balneolaceae bacterium]|nr:RagB/SusD family nutrient uptake outer membrane protein [Balneolaceae bacterium]